MLTISSISKCLKPVSGSGSDHSRQKEAVKKNPDRSERKQMRTF